ncbi:MAG: shikimate kinase [Planctomycetota bacterium]|nr:shikimate kinase [Planctomycetota bacterium]
MPASPDHPHEPHHSSPPLLLLMGLRGSGKSTLGRQLAARLGVRFVDLDDAVLERLGCGSVAQAWAKLGEPAFRRAETECLGEWVGESRAPECPAPARVVALGGGTPTAPGAAELLRRASKAGAVKLVYLRATPVTLRSRLESTEPEAQARSLTRREKKHPLPEGEGERHPLPNPPPRGAGEGARRTNSHTDPNRPSLTGADPLGEIDEVFAARDPLYQELATHVIQIDDATDNHPPTTPTTPTTPTIETLVEALAAIFEES